MQLTQDIAFEKLLKIVQTLPAAQLLQLKAAIRIKRKHRKSIDLESLLLQGPVANKKQLEIIAANKQAFNKWQTK